jgi:tRNA (adenine22-N1)-methyltransferase
MLTPRLFCIYSHISGKTIADIGTDHAYIPIELAKNSKITHALACDINEGPCAIARANIEKEGFSDIIEVRTGSGLSVVRPSETEEIVIAGMGGKLICDILAAHPETAHSSRLILQPMNAQSELRHFLIENGFKITSEDLETEGFKIYNVLTAETGTQKPYDREIDFHVPPVLYSHRHISHLLHKKQREFSKILNGLKRSSEPQNERTAQYEQLYSELERITKEQMSRRL